MKLTPLMWFYAIVAVVALVATWSFNIHFAIAHGGHFALGEFMAGGFANDAASSFTCDLTAAAIAFFVWMIVESRRIGMRHVWIYGVLLWCVAFGVACPVFLLMRERHLQAARGA